LRNEFRWPHLRWPGVAHDPLRWPAKLIPGKERKKVLRVRDSPFGRSYKHISYAF
jgi:hypothetical protein